MARLMAVIFKQHLSTRRQARTKPGACDALYVVAVRLRWLWGVKTVTAGRMTGVKGRLD